MNNSSWKARGERFETRRNRQWRRLWTICFFAAQIRKRPRVWGSPQGWEFMDAWDVGLHSFWAHNEYTAQYEGATWFQPTTNNNELAKRPSYFFLFLFLFFFFLHRENVIIGTCTQVRKRRRIWQVVWRKESAMDNPPYTLYHIKFDKSIILFFLLDSNSRYVSKAIYRKKRWEWSNFKITYNIIAKLKGFNFLLHL